MSVTYVGSDGSELDQAISGDLAIVMFSAKWDGPSRSIAPKFDNLSGQYANVSFYCVDRDELADHQLVETVHTLPTFMFYSHGAKVGEFEGANESSLRDLIEANI
ncbi:thioredoxin family protein [Streptomyces sp. JV184]|uniref:thioredoxin family protein n=1 Tax=Streptomyces sp. JV184 TaxID=858637 RepID=UPI002E75D1CE|nr:thioredoxin family protein [Streptomyces sp. JV184]MEE1744079.1 thioredoxin family protein [Streptomyces sp. JV184]